jgi:hypothetical protein
VDVTPVEELRKIMALLAFTPETVCDRYKVRLRFETDGTFVKNYT